MNMIKKARVFLSFLGTANAAPPLPPPTPSFANRSLPSAPEDFRSLPPAPEPESFPGYGAPQTPTRPATARNNPSLPPLPQKDTEWDSGSGSFNSQKSLPPPPIQNQVLVFSFVFSADLICCLITCTSCKWVRYSHLFFLETEVRHELYIWVQAS